MDRLNNPIFMTDSYKVSHWRQYPPGTKFIHSYFESRGGRWPATVFCGLHAILRRWLGNPKLVVTTQHPHGIADFFSDVEDLYEDHFGRRDVFNRTGWELLNQRHLSQGRWPLVIRGVPEGSVVPTGVPLFTIENTDPSFPWLVNWLETLLVQVWYPTTVATLAHEIRKVLEEAAARTGAPQVMVPFQLHDFGFRGVSSPESAAIGGLGHLLSFKGTDNLAAILLAAKYYNEPMAGFSIPAAEHSTITSWGEANECTAFGHMLDQWPTGVIAVVSDSYDIKRAIRNYWGDELRQRVIERNGTLVIRPDSGDPEQSVLECLRLLDHAFGHGLNAPGFKVLPPYVRLIQGDGVDYESIRAIVGAMQVHGWSTENIAFGMGGALLQRLDRDTQRFALKTSAIFGNAGKWIDVRKSPVGAEWKASKGGRQDARCEDTGWKAVSYPSWDSNMVEYYRDGNFIEPTLTQIRARLDGYLHPEP